MIHVEEGAAKLLDPALDAYEQYFKQSFPLYEHLDKSRDNGFDISLAGARRLATFIANCIEANSPVAMPADYELRIY